MTTVNYRFKVRGRLAAEWTSGNEVLLQRELGLETDTRKFKFGDGVTAWNSLPYVTGDLTGVLLASQLDTDTALTANSDAKIASQKATKAYVDQIVAAQDAMVFKGVIDCSSDPNYPAADRGWTYRASVAGKIGGASGLVVQVGDIILCLNDGTASGNQATVGSSWSVIQTNIDGALTAADIGSTVQAYAAILAAVAALGSNGLLARTGSGTAAARTITGTANEITVTNGDGASGNPTLSIPTALSFLLKTITGGTYDGITLTGDTLLPSGKLSAAGKLGLATTTPEYRLDIGGGSMGGFVDSTRFGNWTPFDGGGWSSFSQRWDSGSSGHRFQQNGVTRFSLHATGGLQLHTYGAGTLTTDASGNVTASSDARLKDVVGPYGSGLPAIRKMPAPVLYRWKHEDNGPAYAGWIAQDVRKAIPAAIGKGSDGMLTLSDRAILAEAVLAIQQMDKTIKAQAKLIERLKK